MFRLLEVIVLFDDNTELTIPITTSSTVENIISDVKKRFPEIASMELVLEKGKRLNPTDHVLTVNPTLQLPFRADKVTRVGAVAFYDESNGKTISLACPPGTTAKSAKVEIAKRSTNINVDWITFTLRGHQIQDNDPLQAGQTYVVKITRPLEIGLQLESSLNTNCSGELVQIVAVDPRKYKQMNDFVNAHCPLPLTARVVEVFCNSQPVRPNDQFDRFIHAQLFVFRHSLPLVGTFWFKCEGYPKAFPNKIDCD
jgi:hypothetical protein